MQGLFLFFFSFSFFQFNIWSGMKWDRLQYLCSMLYQAYFIWLGLKYGTKQFATETREWDFFTCRNRVQQWDYPVTTGEWLFASCFIYTIIWQLFGCPFVFPYLGQWFSGLEISVRVWEWNVCVCCEVPFRPMAHLAALCV